MHVQISMRRLAMVAGILVAMSMRDEGCWTGQSAYGDDSPHSKSSTGRKLSHEETLKWIADHNAWRKAQKTRAIWARPVEPREVGKEFQTADHVAQVARKGTWLCVGVAGEPWFQSLAKIEEKYLKSGEEQKSFTFDSKPHAYRVYKPRGDVWNWAAQVKGPDLEGFYIRPSYDPSRPLYSPSGGYVVRDAVRDPYKARSDEVWLVQEALFTSTYDLTPRRSDR